MGTSANTVFGLVFILKCRVLVGIFCLIDNFVQEFFLIGSWRCRKLAKNNAGVSICVWVLVQIQFWDWFPS